MLKLHVNKVLLLIIIATFTVSTFAGCGSVSNDAVAATVDGFLSSAADGNLDKAGEFASDEVIDLLGWSNDDISAFINDLFTVVGGYGVSEAELMAIPEVQASVSAFTEQLKEAVVTDYTIDHSSVTKTDDGYQVKASVSTISEEDFYSLLDDDLITEISKFSANYATEHVQEAEAGADSEMYTNLYKALIPFIMDKLSDSLDHVTGTNKATWIFTVSKEGSTLLVTGVEAAP